MMWGRIALAVVLAAACQQADDDGEPLDNRAQTSGGSAGSESTLAAAGTGDSQAGSEAAAGGAGSVVEPTTSGGLQTIGGQGGAGALEPSGGACGSDADDGECARCLATQCCIEWQACELDPDCDACTACLDAQMDLGECAVMNLCDIAPEATSQMLLCGLEPCEQECGFD